MHISVLFEILTLIIVGYSAHQNPDSYVFVIVSGIVAFIAIKYITFRTTVKEIERIMSLPDEEHEIPLPEEKPDNPQAIKIRLPLLIHSRAIFLDYIKKLTGLMLPAKN